MVIVTIRMTALGVAVVVVVVVAMIVVVVVVIVVVIDLWLITSGCGHISRLIPLPPTILAPSNAFTIKPKKRHYK